MTPQELKNSILQLAIEGKLVPQRPEEGTAEELYRQIQAEKQALIKAGKIKKESPLPEITEDEKPFDIPESWKWVHIGSIFSLQAGKNIPSENIYDEKSKDNSYPCYGGNGLRGYVSAPNRCGHYALVGRQGALCGNVNFAEGEFYATEHAVVVDHYGICDVIWTGYFLKALNLNQYATATAQPGLAVGNIIQVLIPLPPLAEQKRIVAKIEELLPLIDRYEEAWTKLEAFNKRFPGDLQKSLLQMAIQGKLVPQLPEEGTGEELYAQIQTEKQSLIKSGKLKKEKPLPEITDDEKPFDIPESWKWCCVGDVCTNIQYGTSNKSSISGKVAVLRMGNIQNGKIDYEKLVFSSDEDEIEKYCLEYDDLLFNRTNSKELVGKTAIYKAEMPAIYAGYLVRITPLQMSSDYLNYVMQSQYYWSYCQSVRSDAIGQSNINAEKLKRFVFPLPPLIEQKRIVAKLEELLPLCEKLK